MYSYDESKFDDVNDFNKIIAVLLEFGADPADTGTQFYIFSIVKRFKAGNKDLV